MRELDAMERALELALRGWGRVSPNPLVGAVLLRGEEPIGEGYHAEFGEPHAEIRAIASCEDPKGATLVVNLEPCAHHGKTPPCADALIEARVSRVVFAVRDPDPRAGGGAERLRSAGIEVEIGLLAERAAALNAPFLWGRVRPRRPFVALKLATSLDAFIADRSGESRWISSEEARDYVQWLRAGFDALAVGRRTAETDDPELTVRGSTCPRAAPTRVVFTASGKLSADLRIVETAREVPTVLVAVGGGDAEGRGVPQLQELGVDVLAAADLGAALALLRDRGVVSLLVEGGGALAGALLDADLVDRLYWIQASRWLGGGVPAFASRRAVSLEESPRWVVTERRSLGPDTLLVVDRELCSRVS
ncbi:MAG: bifunctional diaminohydroxyphosphoribosylaminopyrimidine deaminase/5-amino-6-(5-phosphoribosylamino)uracil reductase RibD [Gemmatimonadales bacterium]